VGAMRISVRARREMSSRTMPEKGST
jgi:hypothetical protein